jgi:adenylate cyclase
MGDKDGLRVSAQRALARVEKVIAVEPDHGRALGYGAGLLATLGEAERAKEWIERGTLLDPDNTILHFNFVCALARLREIDAALELLASVINKASQGWLMWLDADTDLDPLRGDPRFAEIVKQAKARFAAA